MKSYCTFVSFFVEARNGGLGFAVGKWWFGLGLADLGVVVVDSVAGLADLGVVVVDSLAGLADLGFGLTARVVEGWLGLVGVVVIRWLGVVDSVGLGLCAGGFGSLPRPGVVSSVGLGLCRGLGWLNRWLGVVVGFALPRSAWGGGFVDSIGLGWWVCAGFGSLPRLTTVVVVVAAVGGKELLDIRTTSSSSSSCSSASPSSSLSPIGSTPRFSAPVADVCHHQILPQAVPFQRSAAKIKPHCAYHAHGKPSHSFLIHNGNGCDYGLNGCSGFVVKGCWRLVVGRGFPTGFEGGFGGWAWVPAWVSDGF
uniref:Uncharacterized protein n=1 Tax=Fagus sylvatica TaxID=28930 RepID=A0A2N9FDD2_FAGSY